MGKGVKIRNTSVNGGMTGRDQTIDKVFAHKGGSTYSTMKVYAPASNPNTEAQQLVRDTFAQTSAGWSLLSEEERDLWNTEAPNWIGSNLFGTTKPSGKNLYTGANVALKSAGRAVILVPDNKSLTSVVTSATMSGNTSELYFSGNVTGADVLETLQLHVSPQLTAGTNSNSKYVILINVPMAATISKDIFADYSAKYGAPIANKKVFWKVKAVSKGGDVTNISQGMILLTL